MKKKFLFTIILCISIMGFVGCTSNNIEMQKKKKNFNANAASNLVENYMRCLVRDDYDSAKKLYSDDMLKEEGKYKKSDIIVRGYNIQEVTEVSKSAIFKVATVSTKKDAYVSLDQYIIQVIKEKDGYKIGEVKIKPVKEVFKDGQGIRMRDKNNVDTNLVIDKDMLPKYVFPKEDKLNLYREKVPQRSFGNMGIAFSGTKVLISTYDKNCYISSILIDESLAVQGQEDNKGGGESQKQDKGIKDIKEKPIGKEISNLDLLKDAKVDYMLFSQDEKFIMVQYTKNNASKCIKLYDGDGGKMVPVKFEEAFPIDKVNVEYYYFDKDYMFFKVTPKKELKDEYKDLIGNWKLDLKDFKIKRT